MIFNEGTLHYICHLLNCLFYNELYIGAYQGKGFLIKIYHFFIN